MSYYEGTVHLLIKHNPKIDHLLKYYTFMLVKGRVSRVLCTWHKFGTGNVLMIQSFIEELIFCSAAYGRGLGNCSWLKRVKTVEQSLDELYKNAVNHIGKPIPFMTKRNR